MFHFNQSIKGNGFEVIIALLIANFLAQFIKIAVYCIKRKHFNTSLMFATGGMPSSHSSTVVAMAVSVALILGWDSIPFAISACFAGIVMFDAAGLRRNASKQAKVLNEIIGELITKGHTIRMVKLKEFLGHTPIEVMAGAALGAGIRFIVHYF